MDFEHYVERQRTWSRETFGEGKRVEGIVKHIRSELKEILKAKSDEDRLKECIDVIILASDLAWRLGFEPDVIEFELLDKQIRNREREWPAKEVSEANQDKPTFHIK